MKEKAKFKVALKQYLNAHSFYSVDEFLLYKTESSQGVHTQCKLTASDLHLCIISVMLRLYCICVLMVV
jgi:hypothetical protein